MNETKPVFLINKYHSILRAAIIVEAIGFLVSLTDGIVAGNIISAEAFAAIGLLTPFSSVALFLSSIVNTGTVLNFSYQVGKFNRRRANEFFSQGVIAAIFTGVAYALLMILLGNKIIPGITPSGKIQQYLRDYYYIISVFFLLQPLSFLLDNILIADGGENLSVVSNTTQIISNIGCSIFFAGLWGIRGIAAASVISRVVSMVIVCFHFSSKKNTLQFVPCLRMRDLLIITKSGIVKASTYGLEAVLTFIVNLFALHNFGSDTLIILAVVERFMGMLTMFTGLGMSCQPLLGTLRGENNTKAQYYLMRTVLKDIIIVSTVLKVVALLFAPGIAFLFGVTGGAIHDQAVLALRILSSTLILQSALVLFFVYYVSIEKQALAFVLCLVKNFISPLILAVVMTMILRSHNGIWIGLAVAPVLAFAAASFIILLVYGRKQYPFLIPENPDRKIFIYDFTIDAGAAAGMSETAETIMRQFSLPLRTCAIAGMITEEVLMLIIDKNEGAKKPVHAECTIITEPKGVKLIIRDSGRLFDITDADIPVDSFRQYVVSSLMLNQNEKMYMITTGYNRNEFFFSNQFSGETPARREAAGE